MRPPRNRCSIVACARWETESITEWLDYHASIGFDHVYLYCNDDDPRGLYNQVRQFLAGPRPFVTFLHFPFLGQQRLMYRHFLQTGLAQSDWVAFLDVDEFLYLPRDGNVNLFLERAAEGVDVLYVNWLMFGNNGHVERPAGNVLENYTRHEPALHPYVKLILRTAIVDLPDVMASDIHFWHEWPLTRRMVRRRNVFGEDTDSYYADFPHRAAGIVQAPGMLQRALSEAVICHFCIKSEADFDRRVARGTAGDFAMQTSWAERRHGGDYHALLESLNAVEFTKLRDRQRHLNDIAQIPSVLGHARGTNLSIGRPATQSSVSAWSLHNTVRADAAGAVSGRFTGKPQFHTAEEDQPWWEVDLGLLADIFEIRLFNRLDPGQERIRHLGIAIGPTPGDLRDVFRKTDERLIGGMDGFPLRWISNIPVRGRYVRVFLLDRNFLHLDQVEVYGVTVDGASDREAE